MAHYVKVDLWRLIPELGMLDPMVESIELVKQMWNLKNVVFLSLIVLFERVDPEWLILDLGMLFR